MQLKYKLDFLNSKCKICGGDFSPIIHYLYRDCKNYCHKIKFLNGEGEVEQESFIYDNYIIFFYFMKNIGHIGTDTKKYIEYKSPIKILNNLDDVKKYIEDHKYLLNKYQKLIAFK